jgi:hypothetical protein
MLGPAMTDRPETIDEYRATYERLVGFVPSRVQARFDSSADAPACEAERRRNAARAGREAGRCPRWSSCCRSEDAAPTWLRLRARLYS